MPTKDWLTHAESLYMSIAQANDLDYDDDNDDNDERDFQTMSAFISFARKSYSEDVLV